MWKWLVYVLIPVAAHSVLPAWGQSISIEGAPADSGFNVGSVATIRAALKGASGDAKRYAIFADIQYVGASAVASVQMDAHAGSKPSELDCEVGWPIPSDAPTGLYSVTIRIQDRSVHQPGHRLQPVNRL